MSDRDQLKPESDNELAEFIESHQEVLDLLDRVWRSDRIDEDKTQNPTRVESEIDTPQFINEPTNQLRQQRFDAPDKNDVVPILHDDQHTNDPARSGADRFHTELPRRIGRFEIVRMLGQGGYGLVYLARDPRLRRDVALKIPRPEVVMTDELRLRFLRESEMAAALSHSQIVPVFEAGNFGPICYIASAFCDGPTLGQWVQQRDESLCPQMAARLVIGLAEAIQHAHLRHVIHRDLKPSNILVELPTPPNNADLTAFPSPSSPDNSRDLPKLWITDFGLAKQLDAIQSTTQSGSIVGTPSFMAPEQIEAIPGEVGPASDIYSLGAILYFLISGRPPLAGVSLLETIKILASEMPSSLRTLRRDIPRDLDAICLKCLEKSPAKRYADATALAADLQRFLEGHPVKARTPSVWDRLRHWAKRNPQLALATAALMVIVPLAMLVTSVLLIRSEQNRSLAESRGIELLAEIEAKQVALALSVRRTEQLTTALDRLFTSVATTPEIRIPGAESLRTKLLNEVNHYALEIANEQPSDGDSRWFLINSVRRIGELRYALRDFEGSLEAAQQVQKLAQTAPFSSRSIQWSAVNGQLLQAKSLAALGQETEFVSTSQSAIHAGSQLRTDFRQDKISLAKLFAELALVASQYGQRSWANQWSAEAVLLWEAVDPNQDDLETKCDRMIAHFVSGNSLAAAQRTDEARVVLEKSLATAEAVLASNVDLSPDVVARIADAYRIWAFTQKNDLDASAAAFARSTELIGVLLLRHPLVGDYSVQLGRLGYSWALADFTSGRFEDAAHRLTQHIEAVGESLLQFPQHESALLRQQADGQALLGYAFNYLNRDQEALVALESACESNRRLVEFTNESLHARLQLQGVVGGLAALYSKLEQHANAVELLQESNEQLRLILENDPDNGECSRFLANNLGHLRTSLSKLGRWEDALVVLNESMQFNNVLKEGFKRGQRAKIHLRLEQWEEAWSDFQSFSDCPAPTNPLESYEFAAESIGILKTLDSVMDSASAADLLRLMEIRETAVAEAHRRLNEMRDNPRIEEQHWRQIFPQPHADSSDSNLPIEIAQWRAENQR